MDDLDRMLRRLVQALRTGFPEYLTRPFEVGELYQRIIPYRHNRRELGLDTNDDYELVLTRLLSGERGYLAGDQQLQDAMREALASSNPDTSAFRSFADARIRITEDGLRQADIPGLPMDDVRLSARPEAPAPFAPPPPAAPVARLAPEPAPAAPPAASASAGDGTLSFRPSAPSPAPSPNPRPVSRSAAPRPAAPSPLPFPAPPPSSMSPSARSVSPSALGGSCRYCGGTLPEGRRYTFCPHCGQNLTVQHCPACNTELEIGWKFCTTCGRAVGDA